MRFVSHVIAFAAGLIAALIVTAGPRSARVIEKHANGAVKAEYMTDAQGRLHGKYTEFSESGRPIVVAEFEHGLSVGASRHYDETGEPVEAVADAASVD